MSNYEPYTLSQHLIDAYFETKKKREFIQRVQERYPSLELDIIEAIYFIFNFLSPK